MTRAPAGVANYPGDCTHIVGEVSGPTTSGDLVVAVAAGYFPKWDRTVVNFATCTDDDLRVIVDTGLGRLDVTS